MKNLEKYPIYKVKRLLGKYKKVNKYGKFIIYLYIFIKDENFVVKCKSIGNNFK